MSRDDAGHFLPYYEKEAGIIKSNPFATLDQVGVGKLMEIAVHGGRATRPNIKLGICGEHGGDPASIEFCNNLGLSYVSCSPFRVPVARIAAAKSAVKDIPPAKKTAAKPVAKKTAVKKAVKKAVEAKRK
jgi:pyruvate,orthophosphate dikinase